MQAGLEEHPQQWVDKMVEFCRLFRPKLKKTGVMWWNIGETYFGGKGKSSYETEEELQQRIDTEKTLQRQHQQIKFDRPSDICKQDGNWLQPKQLLLLPHRFAIALQNDGWILRNCIIWHKPNHMPSSVKDRLANSYEYLFMFVKNKKYWFDLDAIREPHENSTIERNKYSYNNPINTLGGDSKISGAGQKEQGMNEWRAEHGVDLNPSGKNPGDVWKHKNLQDKGLSIHSMHKNRAEGLGEPEFNPSGKNPGDFWRITSKPHPFAHFAVFPEELVERPIKSSCPEQVCVKCEHIRTRQTKTLCPTGLGERNVGGRTDGYTTKLPRKYWADKEVIGWSVCDCNADWKKGVVLDPFMGSGTTAVVSKRLGRNWIGFELNPNYIKIAERRLVGVTNWKLMKDVDSGVQKTLG